MKKFLLAGPLALAAAGLLTTPASAASWNTAGQIRTQIAQLDRQVDNARGLSRAEQRQLSIKVDRLQVLYRSYARGGFTRAELSRLNSQIAQVKADLFRQSHDWNGHGNDHGGYGNGHGNDHGGYGHR